MLPNACILALAAASLVQAAATVPKAAKAVEFTDDTCHNQLMPLGETFSDTVTVNDATKSVFLTGTTHTTFSGIPTSSAPNKCTGRKIKTNQPLPMMGCLLLAEAAGMPNRVKCIQLVR